MELWALFLCFLLVAVGPHPQHSGLWVVMVRSYLERERRQRVVLKAAQQWLWFPSGNWWHSGHILTACSSCLRAASEPQASAQHVPGVINYSGWRHFNVSLYCCHDRVLFLNRSDSHPHLSQHKSGRNPGSHPHLWSQWKSVCRRSQSQQNTQRSKQCSGALNNTRASSTGSSALPSLLQCAQGCVRPSIPVCFFPSLYLYAHTL